jgi:hypothetical protein
MSAWIVGSDHLDLLLTAALSWDLLNRDDADKTGRMLWRENLNSVAYRYPADRDGDRPGPVAFKDRHVDAYRFQLYPGPVDPEVVGQAAVSLGYQSCEHSGWAASSACAFVTRLEIDASNRTGPYIADHGPVDLALQPAGDRGWYVVIDLQGKRRNVCGDGWHVPDRDVFIRAAALRVQPKRSHAPAASTTR